MRDSAPPIRASIVAGLMAAALAACQTAGGGFSRQPDLRAEMAESDVALAVSALQTSLESSPEGTTTEWANPQTGNHGSIRPTRTYQTDSGVFCRTFMETVAVGARTATYEDDACRTADGVWRLVGT